MKGVSVRPDALMLKLDMTRRILTALAAISFSLLVFSSSQFAQERQVGGRSLTTDRSQAERQVVDAAEAERLRGDVITAFNESEELLKFMAGYSFIRQTNEMKDSEVIFQNMAAERARIEKMSTEELMLQVDNWPEARNIGRIIKLTRSLRTDASFHDVLQKVEQYYQSNPSALSQPSRNTLNLRGVIAAPSYIPPNCNFDDPSTYPSGVDIGIAKGVALALHTVVEAQPSEFMIFCTMIPNPFRAFFAALAGIADQVLNALEAVAADAAYCESIRLYVEEQLTGSGGGTTAIMMNDNYYLTFTLKSVRAALSKAASTGVPTNCGNARLTQASAYFDGSDNFNGASGAERVIAYKLLRAAYNNIGASACVQ